MRREHFAFIGEAKKQDTSQRPIESTERITLLGQVSAKHTALGASSALGSRARDAAMPKITQALRDAHDLLLVANRDNPKALGDLGYALDVPK